MIKIVMVAAILALAGLSAGRAEAREYPYCASEGGFNSFVSCGFDSLEQCLATTRGAGGNCTLNPYYRPDAPRARGSELRPRRRS